MLKKHPLPSFFILAYGLTWIGSLVTYLALPQNGQFPAFLYFPGALFWYYGPCLAAVLVTRASGGKGALRRLFSGLRTWRVGWKWYAFILIYPLSLHLTVAYLDWWWGGPSPVFFQAEGVPEGNIWPTLLVLILMQIFMRGIGEETGWRGFALPHLQAKMSPLSASLLLGVLWSLWHFHPANFSAFLSVYGVSIFIHIVLTTVIYTWLYNHTQGSLLIAILFHTSLNMAEFIVPIGIATGTVSSHFIQVGLVALFGAVLVLASGNSLGQARLSQQEVPA